MQDADDILEKYKKHPFAKGLIPFRAAMRSLDTDWPVIYAQPEGRQRWIVYNTNTKEPAMFSHAAVFAEADDQETGNYVPHGQVPPAGVDVKSVQRRSNLKCFYTYILDTYTDMSLYEGQWRLDEYMNSVKGFNPGNLPRRTYLSGTDPRYRSRFWMQTPMFLRRTSNDASGPPPSHLHPWVVQADKESNAFRGNPDRPRIWMKVGERTVPISERTPGILQKGDVVAISFTVTYHLTSVNWFAQFHPADIVVVKEGEGDATDYSAPTLNLHSRPPPSFDTIQEEPGEGVSGEHDRMLEVQTGQSEMEMTGMGGIVVDAVKPGSNVVGRQEESMEVDHVARRGAGPSNSEDLLGDEAFDMMEQEGGEGGGLTDEFVEVVAEDETAAGRIRPTRSVRKRN